ncbi:MAG TPA: glycosyltransferase, partial [Rhodocyclaceae bacterium]|nr:glycosyltransferase [Rhodocyclaceae bacterium]
SKYGISRTFRVILDLVFVYFFMRFRTRPGHFFGGIGLGLGALGVLILGYLSLLKLFTGASIGTRPMFFGGFFFVIAGVQMVTSGVLAELLTRVYFESGTSLAYVARETAPLADEQGWSGGPKA